MKGQDKSTVNDSQCVWRFSILPHSVYLRSLLTAGKTGADALSHRGCRRVSTKAEQRPETRVRLLPGRAEPLGFMTEEVRQGPEVPEVGSWKGGLSYKESHSVGEGSEPRS